MLKIYNVNVNHHRDMLQQSYRDIEKSLSEMTVESTKLSYDNGLLRAAIVQLQSQFDSVPALLDELTHLRRSSVAMETKYTQVGSVCISSQWRRSCGCSGLTAWCSG